MIDQEKISSDWIQHVSKKHRKADPILVEKVIRALLLLEGLVKVKLPFVFKGGTALMLHFHSTKRLSIDIDIILPDKVMDIEAVLQKIVEIQGFTRVKLQHREKRSDIDKAHYKLFYLPIRDSAKEEESVLLDILFEQVHYSNLIQLPIESSFLPQHGEPLMVDIPSIEDLLGDKLTAFAPNTTGISYFKGNNSMSMEIIKQLYDIGSMFDVFQDIQVMKKTFGTFAVSELAYRKQDGVTAEDVMEDIFQTSLSIATRGKDGKANFEELQNGIQRIRSFIFSENYHLEKAITHATKAAYLATILKYDTASIERFTPSINMQEWIIEQPFNTSVNKLKKSNPEAFFYWYKMYELSKI